MASASSGQGKQNHVQISGYGDVPQFGGPGSVGATLREDDLELGYRTEGLQNFLKPYFDWKARVNEKHGLAFSFDYTALYQGANESAGNEDDAAGGIFRFFGSWTMLNRGSANTGSLVYKVENLHRLGSGIAPQGL